MHFVYSVPCTRATIKVLINAEQFYGNVKARAEMLHAADVNICGTVIAYFYITGISCRLEITL